jgi:hypothetical protein
MQPLPLPKAALPKVVRIGRCDICRRMCRPVLDVCADCRMRFGPSGGVVARRVRTDVEYARLCFLALDEHEQQRFVELFGHPIYKKPWSTP